MTKSIQVTKSIHLNSLVILLCFVNRFNQYSYPMFLAATNLKTIDVFATHVTGSASTARTNPDKRVSNAVKILT